MIENNKSHDIKILYKFLPKFTRLCRDKITLTYALMQKS